MGEEILLELQTLAAPWLDWVMGAITYIGSEYFYLPLLCFLYWCIDVTGAMRLFVLLLSSVYLNGAVKEIVASQRPFDVIPELHPRFTETAPNHSFPSGHTQNSVVLWGYLALVLQKRWAYIVAPLMVILVAFSRMYLGLHWPGDILGGIVLGLIILGSGYALLRLFAGVPVKARFPSTLVLALIPLGFFLLLPNHEAAIGMGLLFGAIPGNILERRFIHFPVHRPAWQQAVKLILGLGGTLLLAAGLAALVAPLSAPLEPLRYVPGETATAQPAIGSFFRGAGREALTFARYTLVGLWITLGAPAVFHLLFGREK